MAVRLRWLKQDDSDLSAVAAELNGPTWEVSRHDFSEQSLKNFLADDRRFYLLGYLDDQIAGAIHGYFYLHPTGVNYIWVDEVDVSQSHRRQGVAKAMLQEIFKYAKERGAEEVWLGTEDDNEAALALYRGLNPTDTEHGPTFSWKIT